MPGNSASKSSNSPTNEGTISSRRNSSSNASVDTNNERRDNHLRSGDFFNAEQYPRMTFKSNSVRQVGPNQLVAEGELTIKETTKRVELPISLLGIKAPERM